MTIGIGFYLMDLDAGFFAKFCIMVAGTFAITWIIYEFAIRRIGFMRPLFGMKGTSPFVIKCLSLNQN